MPPLVVDIAASRLAEFLAQSGAIAGGATAWGASLGLILATVAADLGLMANRDRLVTQGGALGAVFGLTVAVAEAL